METKKITLTVLVTLEIPKDEDEQNLVMRIDMNGSYPIKLATGERAGKIIHFETTEVN